MSNVPTNLIPTKITGLPEYLGSSTLGYFPYVLEGRTYKVQFSQLAAVGAVPSTRVIAAGTGLTGGGDLSQDRVISIANGGVGTAQLADSGVIAGVYGSGSDVPVVTVDAKGRITDITTSPLSISGYVPTSRTITTGAGLLGGGSLASNLTLTVDFSSATPQALGSATAGVSTAAARGDHVHPAVDLSDTDQTQGALPLGRGGTGDALSPVAGAVVYSTGTKFALADPGLPGQVLTSDGAGEPYWQTISGTGTVTDVSVVTANGFAGTVANPNTTPAITVSTTVTGVVKGNGTALSAAVAGTDYVAPGVITGSGLTMATSRLLGRTTASSGAVEEITVGTGLSLSGGSLVNSAPDQVVSFTSGTGISVSGTYPAFTITNTAPDQIVSLTGAGTTVVTGTYPNFTITSNDQYTGTVTSVAASGGTTGLSFTGSPITTSGTLTLGGTLVVANGGTGATTAAGARTNLGAAASGANSDITSLSGITGGIATPDYIDFDTTAAPARATGRLWWDNTDSIQTLNLGMAGSNATMQIGEEMYFRVKASSAITEGQVVMFTGTVGASGALTAAPATGLTKDTASYIMGVATEDIALNGWGYVTQFGLVRGINTTGGAEAWVDGQILYYNPAVAGGLTKNVPSAPNAKVEVAAVVNAASGGSGSLFVRPTARFSLGQLNDVETSAAANGDLLQYNSSGGYWQHVAPSTISVGTATNLAGGAANRIAYQTGSGTTGFITAPSVANTFLEWSGSAFQWSSNPLGTVTSVNVSGGTTGLTTSGGPITTSGTITLAGTLAVTNGGTGATSLTSGYLIKGNGTSAVSSSIIYDSGTNVGIGIVPSTKLDVAGPIWSRPGGAAGAVAALFADASSGVNGITLSASFVSGGYGPIKLDAGGSERMRIDSSGNVGIGTSSPQSRLHIDAPFGAGSFFTGVGNNNSNYPPAVFGLNIGYNFQSGAADVDFFNSWTGATGAQGGFSFRRQTGASSQTSLMRIDGSGNLLVGSTSTPSGNGTNLQVANSGAARLWLTSTGYRNFYLESSSGNALQFVDATAGAERMRIDSSGNVGVGTATPGAKLQVQLATSFSWGSAWGSGTAVFGGGTSTAGALGIAYNDTDGASFGAIVPGVAWKDIGFYSNGLIFRTNGGTEAMRITPSQNVGIGNTSPGYRLDITAGDTTAGLGYAARLRSNATAAAAALQFTNNGASSENGLIACTDSGVLTVQGNGGSSAIAFRTNGNERARIDASGNLLVGTTAPLGGNTSNEYKTTVAGSWPLTLNANDRGLLVRNSSATSGFYAYFEYNGGTNNGSISWSGGTTFYNVTSDARIKDNIVDAPEAGDLIDDIKVRSWDFKADGAHWRYGMVAQELIEVVPEAVFVPEDPEQMMGVDYAKLVPLLVKELQSVRARLAALEGK